MQCPSCRADNPPGNRFCDQCGEALEARCPQCSAVLRAGARFCGGCGHRLATDPAAVVERPRASSAPTAPAPPPARPIAPYTHLLERILR
jgi:predicted amidophosphoribosyltransferase